MPAVFIPQSMLDQWADQGQVELQNTTLKLLKEGRSVDLNPAVRFLSVIGDDPDPHGLKGKVKTAEQLKEMGAEHYMDSVILGDVGYQVVEGFMGDLTKPAAEAAQRSKGHAGTVTMPNQPAVSAQKDAPAAAPRAQPAPVEFAGTSPRPVSSEGIQVAVEVAIGGRDENDDDHPGETDAEALSRLFLETVQ